MKVRIFLAVLPERAALPPSGQALVSGSVEVPNHDEAMRFANKLVKDVLERFEQRVEEIN